MKTPSPLRLHFAYIINTMCGLFRLDFNMATWGEKKMWNLKSYTKASLWNATQLCITSAKQTVNAGPIRPRKTSRFIECTHHGQGTSQFALTASQPPGWSLRKCRIKFSSSCNMAEQINKGANGRLVEVAQSKPLCTTLSRWASPGGEEVRLKIGARPRIVSK